MAASSSTRFSINWRAINVQLDIDPHDVDPMHIEDGISVQATWHRRWPGGVAEFIGLIWGTAC